MDKHPIKSARETLGLSQAGFAARLNVSQPTVWRWERMAPGALPGPVLIAVNAILAAHEQGAA